jgi:hypothetical protein
MAHRGVTRDCSLADVERLGADFANMIDPHQTGGMLAFGFIQGHVGLAEAWIGTLGASAAEHGQQCVLD